MRAAVAALAAWTTAGPAPSDAVRSWSWCWTSAGAPDRFCTATGRQAEWLSSRERAHSSTAAALGEQTPTPRQQQQQQHTSASSDASSSNHTLGACRTVGLRARPSRLRGVLHQAETQALHQTTKGNEKQRCSPSMVAVGDVEGGVVDSEGCLCAYCNLASPSRTGARSDYKLVSMACLFW